MKIRNGFVSNSSSSSFIISRTEYPKSLHLAKHMIEIRDAEGWGPNGDLKKIEQALNKKHLDHDVPVTFASCNYDTYITPKQDRYLVSTCNNTNWEEVRGVLDGGGGHDDGDYYEEESKTEFWYVGQGIIGRPLTWDELDALQKQGKIKDSYCNKEGHYRHFIEYKGVIVCPTCWKLANPGKDMYLDREIKIVKPHYIPRKVIRLR